ncbi:uncharacterized protein [Arachis hypogaea]|uniref:uncharacterized protein isoform X1 n=1 Tax=Arachis hypogaea TaxID=3818 RepID=UPI003B221C3D
MQPTSASLTINENYDFDVRDDTETFLNQIVPESMKLMFQILGLLSFSSLVHIVGQHLLVLNALRSICEQVCQFRLKVLYKVLELDAGSIANAETRTN